MRMMKATLAYLTATPDGIKVLIPVLSSLTPAMQALMTAMLAAEQVQGTVAVGAGANKADKKDVLFSVAQPTGKAVLSFANSSGDVQLATLMSETLFELDRKADSTFIMRCKAIRDAANANVAELEPYGITPGIVTALSLAITAFENVESSVRNRIVQRANATTTIAVLQRETTSLLKKEIDPLVASLPDSEEGIVYKREYKKNRSIINLGHKYTQFKGVAVNKETKDNLSNVTLEFKNSERTIIIKTDNDGKYREVLHPDVYDIIATHPNYEPFVINGVEIQAGEIKVENFELVPRV